MTHIAIHDMDKGRAKTFPFSFLEENKVRFELNDGGRAAAGFKGNTGDCVTRAVAIASGLPYKEVYDILNEKSKRERTGIRKSKVSNSRTGVFTNTKWFKEYMHSLGFTWTSCMQIGSGCTVHMREDELPKGRIIVSLSRHFAAVIDGVLNDTYEDTRDGTRCVYGYWKLNE